ncbi:MAG: hypothetical protein GX638_11330 [Crenarchaeota archaeon]|nr:hypothetical protein [Thermoproteota archaeon]
MKSIFQEKGNTAYNKVKDKLLLNKQKVDCDLSLALTYFSKVTLFKALPVFPALVTLSCEAVDGKVQTIDSYGEAILLIAAAADLHDDIIDKSFTKASKKTVYGKFGLEHTILAGDVLLNYGLNLLHQVSISLPKNQRTAISNLSTEAIVNLCIAESLEIKLRNKTHKITPIEFEQLIQLKATFPKFAAEIGAIIGNGAASKIRLLGQVGFLFGVISTIADEFSDTLDFDEFSSRLENECLPYPVICRLQNIEVKNHLQSLLEVEKMDKKTHRQILKVVFNSPETKLISSKYEKLVKNQIKKLEKTKTKNSKELETILLAPLEFISYCSS